jgi:hypothetical protein
MHLRYRVAAATALVAACALSSGCSRDRTAQTVAAMNESNIKRVVNLYTGYQAKHGWSGPKSEVDFKEFITKGMPAENLQMMGVDANNLDAVFQSERDGKPFRIKYGVGGGPGSYNPVVFEQEGQGGLKQVAFTFGKVEEVDDARYKQLWDSRASGGSRSKGPAAVEPGSRPSGRPPGAGPTQP